MKPRRKWEIRGQTIRSWTWRGLYNKCEYVVRAYWLMVLDAPDGTGEWEIDVGSDAVKWLNHEHVQAENELRELRRVLVDKGLMSASPL